MRVFLAGGTGFIGPYLCGALAREGHEVTLLVRPGADPGVRGRNVRVIRGDPCAPGEWQARYAGHEAVINLTGTSIFRLWTNGARRDIFETRIRSTENIVAAMKHTCGGTPSLFNASGVGYYGEHEEGAVDEEAPPGRTFLARVARSWEERALEAEKYGIRVVLCRLGIVLGPGGGAFVKMLTLARHRLMSPWGRGTQWFSWIHERDVAGIFSFLLGRGTIRGPVNVTSPGAVTNREMVRFVNGAVGVKPLIPPVPARVVRCMLGEFSDVFLTGQKAVPDVLVREGYVFRFPAFEDAVADLTGARRADVRREGGAR